ncbi:hypothetical protein ASF53_14230 [Methylobacterium sp. Leaf123]|uniref:hypothetical protein n=1 Tax=Methylobacterium sp. Leaf123 TaxID=1736264 RepID=UPI0006FCF251|nr:hypothetical protein [Methylobacterium sp. Leaf123]KQQ13320.1 hypothetical protein ASF53_14230 [Methylobacterium sp. Leaf123]
MIGLPLYRLLVAVVLVLSSAAATTRLGHAEPKTDCERGAQAGACPHTAEPSASSKYRSAVPHVTSGAATR